MARKPRGSTPPTSRHKPEDGRRRSGRAHRNRLVVQFTAATLAGVAVIFSLSRVPFLSEHVVYPYTKFITASSRAVLRLMGQDVGGEGLMIVGRNFSILVQNVCNGLEVTAIFLATVLAFPTTWRNKLIGVALGFPAIFLINVARIAVLYILGFQIPNIFETVHRYYAQALVIILTLAVWLLWATVFTEYGAKARNRVST